MKARDVIILLILIVLLIVVMPGDGYAKTYAYEATGHALLFLDGYPNADPTASSISGRMSINSDPVLAFGYDANKNIIDYVYNGEAVGRGYFSIDHFVLKFGGGYEFAGSGQLIFNYRHDLAGNLIYSGDDVRLAGSGNWNLWWLDNFTPYETSGPLVDAYALTSLIGLGGVYPSDIGALIGDYPILMGADNLILSRVTSPVPEPSSILLVLVGLLCLLTLNKNNRRIQV